MTEREIRAKARAVGNRAARKAGRSITSWGLDEAAAALAEYRRLKGLPDSDVAACKAALTVLTGR